MGGERVRLQSDIQQDSTHTLMDGHELAAADDVSAHSVCVLAYMVDLLQCSDKATDPGL